MRKPISEYIEEVQRLIPDMSDHSHKRAMQKVGYYQQKEINKLKRELDQQKFNNKHNLSIDQSIADEMVRIKRLLVYCYDIADSIHGDDFGYGDPDEAYNIISHEEILEIVTDQKELE